LAGPLSAWSNVGMTSPRSARLVRLAAVLAVGAAAAVTLAGCSGSAAKAPETVYSAWVSHGSIASVKYSLVDDSGDAHTYTNALSRATWSLSVNAGSKPSLTVKPSSSDGVAHCVVSKPGSKQVVSQRTGAAGQSVVCG
jgi:hypothetical protein